MTQQAGIAEGDGGERQEQCGQRAADGRRRGGSSHGRAVAGALAEPNAGGTDWHGRPGTGIRLVDSEPITAPSAGVPQQARSGLPRGRRVTGTPSCFSMPLFRRAPSARWGGPPARRGETRHRRPCGQRGRPRNLPGRDGVAARRHGMRCCRPGSSGHD
jgi:hypothetical protein